MTTAYRAHYIPNSHLDREWTMDFQHTRVLTVAFIDHLLEILETVPDYRFLMDSQTLPLEDYLGIRPEEEKRIRSFVTANRLHIGPWYSAPDMNMISGEAITRNLLIGHREALRFGKVMKTGYTPFGFVHISQLPQIYRGFGIDTCFFYRGISKKLCEKAEFIWEASDGSRVLASRMSDKPRYNYYMNIWRNGLYADQPERLDRLYHWPTGQQPFKMCDKETRYEHGTLLKRSYRLDKAVIRKELEALIEREKNTFGTHELAFMHGFDTSAPDMLEDEVLRLCQDMMPDGVELFYSSLPEYADALKRAVDIHSLPVLRGEMKYPEIKPSGFHQTFINIISTRPAQKQKMTRAENLLVRKAEPFAAVAHGLGQPWPTPFVDQAWRHLLKTHAHDTVGGCAIDRVEEDAMYHLNQSHAIAKSTLKESLGAIQARIETGSIGTDAILITLFNPSPYNRTESVTCFVDIPRALNMNTFRLVNQQQETIPLVARKTGAVGKVYRDPKDLALYCDCDEMEVTFEARDVPALGYDTYSLVPGQPVEPEAGVTSGEREMENEHIKVEIASNGALRMTEKSSGKTFNGLHVFEDKGEAGHPWMHMTPQRDERITSESATARIRKIEDSPLRVRFEVALTLDLPATTLYDREDRVRNLGEEKSWRSEERVPLEIVSVLTLTPSARALDVQTTVNNQSRNHRLRMLFPTGLKTDVMFADNPYDVLERRIPRDEQHPLLGIKNIDYSFLTMIDLHDTTGGLSFLGVGLKEYEVLDDATRTLAVTLFRSCENWLCTTSVWDFVPDEGLQALGAHVFHYRLYPHAGGWEEAESLHEAEKLNLPLIPCQAGADPVGAGQNPLPMRQSFLSIDHPNVRLSGLKKAEDSDALILRVFNPTSADVACQIRMALPLKAVQETNMNEEAVEDKRSLTDGCLALTLKAKQVRTYAWHKQ